MTNHTCPGQKHQMLTLLSLSGGIIVWFFPPFVSLHVLMSAINVALL